MILARVNLEFFFVVNLGCEPPAKQAAIFLADVMISLYKHVFCKKK